MNTTIDYLELFPTTISNIKMGVKFDLLPSYQIIAFHFHAFKNKNTHCFTRIPFRNFWGITITAGTFNTMSM